MRRALRVATLLAAMALPAGAAAQTEPGGVATSVVFAPVDPGVDSVDYVIEPAPGIRFFTERRGRLAVRNGRALLPVTFGVPADAPALPLTGGTVLFRWPGGSASRDAVARVAPRRGVELQVSAPGPYAVPGRTALLRYIVRNTGNAVDTVSLHVNRRPPWSFDALPEQLVLPPGDSAVGSFRATLRAEAQAGTEHLLLFTARSADDSETRAQLRLIAVSQIPGRGGLDALADLPSTLFVGTSAGAAGKTGIALRSVGAVGQTDVELDLRLAPDGATPPAFQGMFAGPEARLMLRRGHWSALGGDIFLPANILLGTSLRGRGARLAWQSDARAASAFLAVPGTRSFGAGEDGHMASGSYRFRTLGGSLELTGADVRRRLNVAGHRATGLSALYETEFLSAHGLDVELALLHLDPDSAASVTGPGVDAGYTYRTPAANASLRLRRIPGTVSGRGGLGNEVFFSGSIEPWRNMRITGWGFIQSQPFLEREVDPRQKGAALGARVLLGGVPVQLTGRLGDAEDPNAIRQDVESRSVELGVDWPLGPLTLETDAEVGRTRVDGEDLDLLRLRGGASWRRPSYSVWSSATYSTGRFDRDLVLIDLAGRARVGTVDIDAGANAQLDEARPFADEIRFWSSVSFPLGPATRIRTGLDYLPFSANGGRWRVALGASREFDLPLPIERPPALQGLVFEDTDADGEYDPGEPLIPGVELRFGFLVATSDEEGRFRFLDSGGGAVRPDPRTLPFGLLLPDDARLDQAGFIQVPLVRATSLELVLFLDRDNDQERDPIETPAERAVVRLIEPGGRTRSAIADTQGRVRFASLPPGDYTISILPAGATPRDPVEIQITIPSGQTVHRTIAVPLRQREIRIG